MPKMPGSGTQNSGSVQPPLRKTKVQTTPNGAQLDGFEIPVRTANEKWSEYELEDGTVIRMKQVVFEIIRVVDTWDAEGNPMYVTKASPVLNIVSVPDSLKKK